MSIRRHGSPAPHAANVELQTVRGPVAAALDTSAPAAAAPAPISFSVPAVPRSRNRLGMMHWAALAKDDARWRNLLDLHRPPGARISGPVVVTLTFWTPRPPDPDNPARQVLNALKDRYRSLGGRMMLVGQGVIDDDDWATLTELRLRSRRGPARTDVLVEPACGITSDG